MVTDEGETIEDDIDNKELLQEVYGKEQDSELTRLTEMVRKHYLNYLEKQLYENLLSSNYNNKKNAGHEEDYDEMCKRSIKKTAELLEDKAVKACMIAKFYQRAMVKIIAIVRRTTDEKRLIKHLEKCFQKKDESKPLAYSKETQTEAELSEVINFNEKLINSDCVATNSSDRIKDKDITLDEKIEMFKKHLQKGKCMNAAKKCSSSNKQKKSKRNSKHKGDLNSHRANYRHRDERHHIDNHEPVELPTPISPVPKQLTVDFSLNVCKDPNLIENEDSNDSIALELARLFREEKTELDEIFGIDPNAEPDDPQICKILKEIEEAIVVDTKIPTKTTKHSDIENPPSVTFPEGQKIQSVGLSNSIDLSKSIWPCELFMQRRKLSESLARLIEEDLRWHDVIKWKFSELFGEDSDDEFTPCSPSIELNEVLIGSCVRRISPWVVKYLMKPMKDGLIGNRFLFKKLAKNLARNIIMENQYPDESAIRECVENYFCLHQTVMSLEDIEASISSI